MIIQSQTRKDWVKSQWSIDESRETCSFFKSVMFGSEQSESVLRLFMIYGTSCLVTCICLFSSVWFMTDCGVGECGGVHPLEGNRSPWFEAREYHANCKRKPGDHWLRHGEGYCPPLQHDLKPAPLLGEGHCLRKVMHAVSRFSENDFSYNHSQWSWG